MMPDAIELKLETVALLAARVAEISQQHQESMTRTLNVHTESLSMIRETLARVDGRTEGIVKDIARQEAAGTDRQRQIDEHDKDINKLKGFGAAIAFLLSCGEAALTLFFERH
jgi:hypothetical protein